MAITNQVEQVRSRKTEVSLILENLTYDRVDAYIEDNITSLSSAKEYLKKLSKIVLYIEKTK